ncbi:hypothetical protein AB0362_12985 [Rhodococcus sp. NPDC079359]|uniref:hypothetical protein n=1 Tax=Rhodococcus sp. NPDC079359 TaxID=3154961 RepID=UPI00344D4DAC
MSATEFVVFDGTEEVDWIGPVEGVRETDDHWFVDNGHDVYQVDKRPGRTVAILDWPRQ